MSPDPWPAEIRFQPQTSSRTRVDVLVNGESVSHCGIVRLRLRFGCASVLVDGIADVWTEEEHRRRGYARRLLEASVRRMRGGDATLSSLYGIPDFYPKFGYATVGFDFGIRLNELDRHNPIPDGWTIRTFVQDDLPAIRQIYERATVRAVGASIRPPESWVWERLAACADPDRPVWEPYDGSTARPARDECRVAIGPNGQVQAYFWRGKGLNYMNLDERHFPAYLCIGEAVADNPPAADAILAACQAYVVEESSRVAAEGDDPHESLRLGVQPGSRVATAAQYQVARSTSYSWDCGGPMVRVLDLERLFTAIRPELEERWISSRVPFRGSLHLHTDLGSVILGLGDHGVTIGAYPPDIAGSPIALHVQIPQTAVARLVLGGFPPEDLLERLGLSYDDLSAPILAALFPQRHPYLYLADRP
jgi:GNAT superfamily N-acetyltransferase